MFELFSQQPLYFHINFWLFIVCSITAFISCLLPQRGMWITCGSGKVYLPPRPLTTNKNFPDVVDQILALIFIAFITLLYASSQLPTHPTEAAEAAEKSTDTVAIAWFNLFFTVCLFFPLVIKYIFSHFGKFNLNIKSFLYVIIGLFSIYAFSILVNISGLLELLIHWTDTPAEQVSVQAIKETPCAAAMIPMALSAIIVAPIVEEVFFRGFIFSVLNKRIGLPAAAILSGLLFGAIHFSLAQTIVLSFFGIVQSYLYRYTGSLLYPILLHFIFNFLAFCAILIAMNL